MIKNVAVLLFLLYLINCSSVENHPLPYQTPSITTSTTQNTLKEKNAPINHTNSNTKLPKLSEKDVSPPPENKMSPKTLDQTYSSIPLHLFSCDGNIYTHYLEKNKNTYNDFRLAYLSTIIPESDMPIILNKPVLNWIKYFQTRGRKIITKWLQKGPLFIPTIQQILSSHNLPLDLVYLSMIECGFNNKAYSFMKASGAWQFMTGTGRKYGLSITPWVDERRNLVKATHAAAKYLRDLYKLYNNWYLSIAAYNAGEGKINTAIKRYERKDFWHLTKYNYLKNETKNFVPKYLAALIIAKSPEKFGVFIPQSNSPNNNLHPSETITLDLPKTISILELSKKINISYKLLRNLNPELRTQITPPQQKHYPLVVPKTALLDTIQSLNTLSNIKISDVVTHRIRRGETLASLARKYGTSIKKIRLTNPNLNPRRLRIGKRVKIPVNYLSKYKVKNKKRRRFSKRSRRKQRLTKGKYYKVRRGDTLWDIAIMHKVKIKSLLAWNRIKSPSHIRIGQIIKIKPD